MKIKLPPRKFSESIKINCNKKTVYDILGNSKNVRKWSVYVHHIKPINKITGGKLGSRRRCYRNKDESNMRWDEEVILDKKYQTRRLSIYNLSGFLSFRRTYNPEKNFFESFFFEPAIFYTASLVLFFLVGCVGCVGVGGVVLFCPVFP